MSKQVELAFGTPNPIQQRALDLFREGKRFVLINTGRQAGKSHFGARWTVAQIASGRGKNKLAAVIAPTFRDARVADRKLKEVLQEDPRLWSKIKYRSQPIPTFQFPNGYLLEVHSAHDPDSLRGPTFDFIWFDEVAKAAKEAFDVVTPTLLASKGLFLGTTTPRGKQNWIYKTLYLRSVPPGEPDHDPNLYHYAYGTVTGSTRENAVNLSDEAVDQLENQYGEGSAFALQEIAGEFVSFKGLVYQWAEEQNYILSKDMPLASECSIVIGGLDFGWYPDPDAAYVLGYKEGIWYCLDGFSETKLLTNDLAVELSLLTKKYGVTTWYGDSARPDDIAELRSRGIPVRGVEKPRIHTRVKEMAMFADHNRFKVSTRCPDVRNEFQMYMYPNEEKLEGMTEAKPLDKHNHAMDAIGYALWSVRYLWRNDPGVTIEGEEEEEDLDDETIVLKDRRKKIRPLHRASSGLYS